jgi:hypothetical protein
LAEFFEHMTHDDEARDHEIVETCH